MFSNLQAGDRVIVERCGNQRTQEQVRFVTRTEFRAGGVVYQRKTGLPIYKREDPSVIQARPAIDKRDEKLLKLIAEACESELCPWCKTTDGNHTDKCKGLSILRREDEHSLV